MIVLGKSGLVKEVQFVGNGSVKTVLGKNGPEMYVS